MVRKLSGKEISLAWKKKKLFYQHFGMACDRDQNKDLNYLNVSLSTAEKLFSIFYELL